MARISDIHSVIVLAQNANLTAHTYTEIYGGTAGCTINVNGVIVNVAASSNIPIWVNNVSGGTGCYLMGENQNVFQGPGQQNISGFTGNYSIIGGGY